GGGARIAGPGAVLPRPDSPTSPSVSPARSAKLTPSTALTTRDPPKVKKCVCRSDTWSTGAPSSRTDSDGRPGCAGASPSAGGMGGPSATLGSLNLLSRPGPSRPPQRPLFSWSWAGGKNPPPPSHDPHERREP